MDPSSIWPEIAKMGSVALLMGIAIWWLATRLKSSEDDFKRVQEARLNELKETGNLYNQALKQLDTTTQLIAATPKALADFQEKIRDSVDDLTRTIEDLQREVKK